MVVYNEQLHDEKRDNALLQAAYNSLQDRIKSLNKTCREKDMVVALLAKSEEAVVELTSEINALKIKYVDERKSYEGSQLALDDALATEKVLRKDCERLKSSLSSTKRKVSYLEGTIAQKLNELSELRLYNDR